MNSLFPLSSGTPWYGTLDASPPRHVPCCHMLRDTEENPRDVTRRNGPGGVSASSAITSATIAHPIGRYALAISITAAALALRLALPLSGRNVFILFYPATVAAASLGGFGPGLLAAALGALAGNFFLTPPYNAFSLDLDDLAQTGLFFAMAVLMAWLMARTRQAEARARAEGERYRVTLAGIGDAVIATDANGRVTFMNAVAEQLTGWPTAEATGRLVSDVFPISNEDTGEPVEDPIGRVLREGIVVGLANHTVLRARDGAQLPIADSGAPLRDGAGVITGAVLVFHDVSRRRALERDRDAALAEAERDRAQLRHALQDAQQAVADRERFLSIASHELRTPVTTVKGHAQALRRALTRGAVAPDRIDTGLRSIVDGADRLTALVQDLLDVSRLRTGRLSLQREPSDLMRLVRDVVARHAEHLAQGRRIETAIPDLPSIVSVDPLRIEQVLVNLLSNAVKYAPDGSPVTVSAHPDASPAPGTPAAGLASSASGASGASGALGISVQVRDKGIGLPPGALEKIFTPFGRAPNAGHIPGMGLGLYISRSIAEQHGGRLWAESPGEGQGTTFILWLPYEPPAESE